MTETPKEFIVEVSTIGYKKEDFKLKLEENMLTIEAEMKEEKEEGSERYTRQEFRRSSFSRSFKMPKDLASDTVDAKYENGILKIELPNKVEIKTLNVREIMIS